MTMNKKSYIKPCINTQIAEVEPLLAGSFGTNDKTPSSDNELNQFSKNHKTGTSLWDETWDSDDDDANE